jgi:hypothetical protein
VRSLRTIRYSSRRGRRVGITFIARRTGYRPSSLYRVIVRGWCSWPMAKRLGQLFKNVSLFDDHTAFSSLGPLDGGRDPRGRYPAGTGRRPRPWPRPVAGALPAKDIASNSRNECSSHLQVAPPSSKITLSFQHVWARTVGGRKR